MAFVIEKVGKGKQYLDGHYINLDGIDWLVSEVVLDNSGNLCLKLYDHLRKQNQIIKPLNLEQIVSGIPGAQTFTI